MLIVTKSSTAGASVNKGAPSANMISTELMVSMLPEFPRDLTCIVKQYKSMEFIITELGVESKTSSIVPNVMNRSSPSTTGIAVVVSSNALSLKPCTSELLKSTPPRVAVVIPVT